MAHFRNTFCDNSICVLSMKTMFCEQTLNAKYGILVQNAFCDDYICGSFNKRTRIPSFLFYGDFRFLNLLQYLGGSHVANIPLRDHHLVVVKSFVCLYEPIEVCRRESQ